jgi:hypothetical protein
MLINNNYWPLPVAVKTVQKNASRATGWNVDSKKASRSKTSGWT